MKRAGLRLPSDAMAPYYFLEKERLRLRKALEDIAISSLHLDTETLRHIALRALDNKE